MGWLSWFDWLYIVGWLSLCDWFGVVGWLGVFMCLVVLVFSGLPGVVSCRLLASGGFG